MRELDGGLEENAEHLLAKVEGALRRLDDGTYGTCAICGRPIEEERLRAVPYAKLCIDNIYPRTQAFFTPTLTKITLVQGDALGGGFECALASDVIVAEESAQMGLPEILFNLFPGMGAYSLLSRKLDPVRAERMILSGRLYSAAELHDIGLVDIVDEVVTNVLRYGAPGGQLRAWAEEGRMICEVAGGGSISDPLVGRLRPGPDQPAGRGLWIANHLCDLVQIRTGAVGTVVRCHVGPVGVAATA